MALDGVAFVCLLLCSLCSAVPPVVRVRKCCPLHQQLALDQRSCVDYEYDSYSVEPARSRRSPARPPWWLSPELLLWSSEDSPSLLSASDVSWLAEPGSLPRCDYRDRSLLLQTMEDFSVDPRDGSMMLDPDDGEPPVRLARDDYCLDRLYVGQGAEDAAKLVALVCACGQLTCWRKCCQPWSTVSVLERDHTHEAANCDQIDEEDWDSPPTTADNSTRRWRLFGFPECSSGEHVSTVEGDRRYWLDGAGIARVEGVSQALPRPSYCADRSVLLYCSGVSGEDVATSRQRGVAYGVLFCIAAFFLLATVCVYTWLPGLLARMHARTLVCHALSLLAGYLAMAVIGARPDMPQPACTIMAFVLQFSFLAAFFWLNVMCIDISWAFSGLRAPQGSAAERDRKKFVVYSVYAWGATAAICVATAAVEFSPGVASSDALKPNFGAIRCWFKGKAATLLYFYGPVACLLLANLLLFAFTAARIMAVRSETNIWNHADSRRHDGRAGSAYKRERERLSLYAKLFALMGLTWVMETVSWAVGGPSYYWYLTDLVNLLRAVFLFYIFCCKRSVLRMVRQRLPSCCPCSLPASGSSSGSGTNTVSYGRSKANGRSVSMTSQLTNSISREEQMRRDSQQSQKREPKVATISEEVEEQPSSGENSAKQEAHEVPTSSREQQTSVTLNNPD